MKFQKIISLLLLLSICLSTFSGCFLKKEPGSSGEQGGSNESGENGGESGTNGGTSGGDSGNAGGNTENEKPKEPDPDAGKNGIEEILLAFSEAKVADGEINDTVVNAPVKSYTFNKLDANDATNPVA